VRQDTLADAESGAVLPLSLTLLVFDEPSSGEASEEEPKYA
jgi:hypothetical protein